MRTHVTPSNELNFLEIERYLSVYEGCFAKGERFTHRRVTH